MLLSEADSRIRRLERAALSGDPEAVRRHRREKLKAGEVPEEIEHFHKAAENLEKVREREWANDPDWQTAAQAADDARHEFQQRGKAVAKLAHDTGIPLGHHLDRKRIHPADFGRAIHLVGHHPDRESYGTSETVSYSPKRETHTNWHAADDESHRHLAHAVQSHGFKLAKPRENRREVRIRGVLPDTRDQSPR